MPGFGYGYWRRRTGGGDSYDPAAQDLFARMDVQPDGTRKKLISDTIAAMKGGAGGWSKLRVCSCEGAHDAQAGRLNWIEDQFNLTAVGSPVFTVDRGYMTDGATSYLDTGFIPSVHGANLNSFSMGCYINAGDNTASQLAIGMGTTGANASFLIPYSTGDVLRGRVNGATTVNYSASTTSRFGFAALSRTGANVTKGYKNSSISAVNAEASSSLPGASIFIGGANSGSALVNGIANRFAFTFIAAGLTDAEEANIAQAALNYLTAIGAN